MDFYNGRKYDTVYQRAAASFLSTCAAKPQEESQLSAYGFINAIYQLIYDDVSKLGWKNYPDTWFEPWEQQKERQKDVKLIRDSIAKIEGLIKALFDFVDIATADGDCLIAPAELMTSKSPLYKAITAIGCEVSFADALTVKFPHLCAKGLKQLAGISKQNVIPITDCPQEDKKYVFFSRCVFDPTQNWIARVFDKLLQANGKLIETCEALEKRGYKRIDCKDGKRISLDYVKPHGKKQMPVKISWADQTHSGIEVTYEELRLEPAFFWIRVPNYKTVLANADKLPEKAVDFFVNCTKRCNGCKYCVQTDKTHTRPVAAISLKGKALCPLYPSFTMNWRSFSAELAEAAVLIADTVDNLAEVE